MEIKLAKKLPTTKRIIEAIDNYEKSHQGKPIFLELLSQIGMLWDEWVDLKQSNPDLPQVRMLEMYHQHILVQLEKILVYNNRNTNVGALMFYLKKSHPNRYGEKVIEIKTKQIDHNKMYDELKNESEIDLMKLSVC